MFRCVSLLKGTASTLLLSKTNMRNLIARNIVGFTSKFWSTFSSPGTARFRKFDRVHAVIEVIDSGRYTTEILSCHLLACGWTICEESREIHLREFHGDSAPNETNERRRIKISRAPVRLLTVRKRPMKLVAAVNWLMENVGLKCIHALFLPKIPGGFPRDTLDGRVVFRRKKTWRTGSCVRSPVESFLMDRCSQNSAGSVSVRPRGSLYFNSSMARKQPGAGVPHFTRRIQSTEQ